MEQWLHLIAIHLTPYTRVALEKVSANSIALIGKIMGLQPEVEFVQLISFQWVIINIFRVHIVKMLYNNVIQLSPTVTAD